MASDTPHDETDRSLTRRRVLEIGTGLAASATALTAGIGTVAAHFPAKLEIDVVPWLDRNPVVNRDGAVVPVAVQYTEFEDDDGNAVTFDPTERPVNYRFGTPETLASGGGARPRRQRVRFDVNGDRRRDLLLFFPVAETGIDRDTARVELRWARHEDGHHGYSGRDSVTVVGFASNDDAE